MFKKFLVITCLSILCASNAWATRIWMEAESGAEYDPILIGSDMTATDDSFLVSWRNANYSSRSNDDGRIIFEVSIPSSGTYKFWGRVRVPYSGARPYDISTGSGNPSDDSQWTRWNQVNRPDSAKDTWMWHYSGVSRYFSKGVHKIYLIQRLGGSETHIDKILLTNESSFTPTGNGGAESSVAIDNPYRSNTVNAHGQLRVSGNRLVNKNGSTVQLQGISTHGLQWFPLGDNQTIPNVAEYFGAEVVRLAMYVEDYDPQNPDIFWGGYMANKNKLLARMEQGIEDAINAGIYVLVDWHIHDVPGRYTSVAGDFFEHIAQKYGHHPNIIYEICNEPVATSWNYGIKPYAESVISKIRKHDPDNIIIVGTPNWSQDVDTAASNPLSGNNIMYAFHFYAATHSLSWAKNKINTAMNAGLAIFVSEWGSSDVGTSRSNFGVAEDWVQFLDSKNISWINWSLGNKDENSSILKPDAPLTGPWFSGDLTTAGSWVKNYFDPPTAGSGSSSSGGSTASTIKIEAESYSDVVGSVSASGHVGYLNPNEALIYNNVKFDGLSRVTFRYSARYGGYMVEIRKNSTTGKLLGTHVTDATGDWGKMHERTATLTASATGTDKLVLLFKKHNGSGGVMNLDHFVLGYSGSTASTSGSTGSSSTSTTKTLLATDDAFVRSGNYQNDNYGASNNMMVKNSGGNYNRQALIKFNHSSVSGAVKSAKLRMKVDRAYEDALTTSAAVYEMYEDGWKEETVTYANMPDKEDVIAAFKPLQDGKWIEVDVTPYVKSQAGQSLISFAVANTSGGGKSHWLIHSKESGVAPQLVVTY